MLEKDGLSQEVSIGVTYSALMSAVSLFFTGVIISQFSSFDPSIKVPLVLLIISTFSFIFSATIYTNASTEITLNKLKLVKKYMIYGKNVMEVLGLYTFVLATPLVVGAVTNDNFIKLATIIVALIGFGLYSQSKFSVLHKEMPGYAKRSLSLLIVVLTSLLYAAQSVQIPETLVVYDGLAVVITLIFIVMTYHFSTNSKQYDNAYFRSFELADAGALAAIVTSNLDDRKLTRHYSGAAIQKMRRHYSARSLQELARKNHVIVAVLSNRVAGMVALDKNVISTVFTDQNLHHKGLGRMLVDEAEAQASRNGFNETVVKASMVDHDFYARLGYTEDKETGSGDEKQFVMTKALRPVEAAEAPKTA